MIDKVSQPNNSELSARKADTLKARNESDRSGVVKPQAVNTSKLSSTIATNTPRSVANLATTLGLPPDKLSSAIISFARFFSLPLKPQLLADLRRNAFMSPATRDAMQTVNQSSSANAPTEKSLPTNTNAMKDVNDAFSTEKTRQAFSLSAAAVESKGVELSPKGLESYAQAVDPDSRRQDGNNQRRRKDREQNDNEEKTIKTESVKKPKQCDSSANQFLTADSIKKMSLEYAQQNPLLEILNRLPCKNGQRWIVLPFNFEDSGKNYSVSMRVLIDEEKSTNHAVCMALDILESAESTPNKRWLFVMDSANDKPMRISVYLQDALSQKNNSMFKSELSKLFNIPLEHVNIINTTEPFPYEASFAENFSSIDEAV